MGNAKSDDNTQERRRMSKHTLTHTHLVITWSEHVCALGYVRACVRQRRIRGGEAAREVRGSPCCVCAPQTRTRRRRLSRSRSQRQDRTMRLFSVSTLLLLFFGSGLALQIQCYQCEEMTHDCSTPEFIVNCTVNVQDMCQKEVLVKDDGIHYRKSCASSGACLIASSGYQQFCTGKLNSVCITCCNTPLCNGPRQKKRPQPSAAVTLTTPLLPVISLHSALLLLLCSALC